MPSSRLSGPEGMLRVFRSPCAMPPPPARPWLRLLSSVMAALARPGQTAVTQSGQTPVLSLPGPVPGRQRARFPFSAVTSHAETASLFSPPSPPLAASPWPLHLTQSSILDTSRRGAGCVVSKGNNRPATARPLASVSPASRPDSGHSWPVHPLGSSRDCVPTCWVPRRLPATVQTLQRPPTLA